MVCGRAQARVVRAALGPVTVVATVCKRCLRMGSSAFELWKLVGG